MRRPRLRTSPASLALAAAIAATSLASLVTASSSSGPASPHAPHPAGHGAIPHAAGHSRFAARAAAGSNSDPDLLLVERGAADDQARSALFEGEVAGNAIAGEVKISGWTADDDLWMTSGTYDVEGAAGALHIKVSDNSTTAASASSAGEDDGEAAASASASAAAAAAAAAAASAGDGSSSQAASPASASSGAASGADSTTSCTDAQATSTASSDGRKSSAASAASADSAAPTGSSSGARSSTTSRKMFHGPTGSSTKVKATGTKTLDPDSLETKLWINPKWIALNPKWTPTALLATVVTSAPTKTSSASATKTSTVALTLPAPPASTCQPQYTNTAGGAVYGPGLGSFNFLPRPSTFVKRSGNKLTLDGDTYRIVGPSASPLSLRLVLPRPPARPRPDARLSHADIYWLGLDENVNWQVSYPSKQRVREAMAITVAMGGNTIRSHTLGVRCVSFSSIWRGRSARTAADSEADDLQHRAQQDALAQRLEHQQRCRTFRLSLSFFPSCRRRRVDLPLTCTQFDSIDYAIFAARNYGLRLIIPLTGASSSLLASFDTH